MLFRLIDAIEHRHRRNKDCYHRAINVDFMALLVSKQSCQTPVAVFLPQPTTGQPTSVTGEFHNTLESDDDDTQRVDKVKLRLVEFALDLATGELNGRLHFG